MALSAWTAAGPYPGRLFSPRTEKTTLTTDRFGDRVATTDVVDGFGGAYSSSRISGRYGDDIVEESVRDPVTGRSAVTRIRSDSPVGRLSRFADPLHDGVYGYGRYGYGALADPLYRGRYGYGYSSLDDPLYRRSYLDDPLYRGRLDDPLYRGRYGLDDPLYRGRYGLDDPLYRGRYAAGLYGRGFYDDALYGSRLGYGYPGYGYGRYGAYAYDDPLYRSKYLDLAVDPLYRSSLRSPLTRTLL